MSSLEAYTEVVIIGVLKDQNIEVEAYGNSYVLNMPVQEHLLELVVEDNRRKRKEGEKDKQEGVVITSKKVEETIKEDIF